jgi:tetratricopeptide (TPR) repeat protein
MFQPWRMQLRQAEAAWKAGQLDEASRLLAKDELGAYLPAKEVSLGVASALVERGQKHVEHGDTLAGWRDLETALTLTGETAALAELRRLLVEQAHAEAERYLAAEDASAALACLERLRRRECDTAATRLLEQVAKRWLAAGRLIRLGDFAAAEAELSAAGKLRPDLRSLENRLNQCRVQLGESRALWARLKAAVAGGDWSAANLACDRLLTIAPENIAARQHREKLARSVSATRFPVSPTSNIQPPTSSLQSPAPSPQPLPMSEPGANRRMIAWVDAVGGYLICLGDQVILGQPSPGGGADVPILADLSRRHAAVRRDGEGYTLVPLQATKLDGRLLDQPAPLADGNEIELGDGVKLKFRRPHPLSSTAVLEFVSKHRTKPKVDAIVLMAQTCVFSPRQACHVRCRNWPDDLILFRDGKNLGCRTNSSVTIDGKQVENRGPIVPNSRIQGAEFAITLEELES